MVQSPEPWGRWVASGTWFSLGSRQAHRPKFDAAASCRVSRVAATAFISQPTPGTCSAHPTVIITPGGGERQSGLGRLVGVGGGTAKP